MKLTRRRFLRVAGVSLALPWLDALAQTPAGRAGPPRRMVCVCTPLGLHAPYFFPQERGRHAPDSREEGRRQQDHARQQPHIRRAEDGSVRPQHQQP